MLHDNEMPAPAEQDTGLHLGDAKEVSPENTTPEINLSDPIEFLRRYSPQGPWVLTAIGLHGDRKVLSFDCSMPEQWAKAERFIAAHNGKNNLYFLLGTPKLAAAKKMAASDMVGAWWGWVDLDPRAGEDEQEERQRIRSRLTDNLPPGIPKPTLIIDSGRGYWGLWQFQNHCGDNETVQNINRALSHAFGGLGDSCHSIDHIGRLPFTVNMKTQREASVVQWNEGLSYTIADFPQRIDPVARHGRIESEVQSMTSLDELGSWNVPDKVRMVINQGFDPENPRRWPSRSEAVYFVACQLVRCAVPDVIILGILLNQDFGISDSMYRTKEGARISNPEKYARRQIAQAHKAAAEEENPFLAELNSRHAVMLQEGGTTRVLSWETTELDYSREVPVLQSFTDFRNRYLHRKVQVGMTKEGTPVFISAGKYWLEHPQRREYLGLRFLPGQPAEVDDYLNMWRGFSVEPSAGDWSLMRQHIHEVLAARNDSYADYILKWSAWAVQHPDEPAEVALVFQGGRGTGKGTFARTLKRLFGQHGLQVTSPTQLTGRFNAHLRDCCLLFGDEAIAPGDKVTESVLKGLITEPELTIEGKGVNVVQARNRLHVVMASNEDWVIPAGIDERRFAIFEASAHRVGDKPYFAALNREIENGGLAAMLYDLQRYPLEGWHPRNNVPDSPALRRQKELSLPPFEQWLLHVLEEGSIDAAVIGSKARAFLSNDINGQPGIFTCMRKTSPKLRDMSDQKLAHALKSWGCTNYHTGAARGWTFPSLQEMRAEWDRRFGKRAWNDTKVWAGEDNDTPF